MYQKILSGKITFPSHIAGPTKDIIRGVCRRSILEGKKRGKKTEKKRKKKEREKREERGSGID